MTWGIDRMRRAAVFASIVVLLVAVGYPRVTIAASASGWPVKSSRILVRFEERYEAERTFTHRGVDIAARAGESVSAPLAGEISFVGSVPAAEGRTRLAISIRLEDGRILTLLPLESILVEDGDRVVAGDALASVAAGGDLSHVETHLHVGLREGSRYRDPLSLLTPPVAAPTSPVAEAIATASVPELPVAPLVATSIGSAPSPVASPVEATPSSAPVPSGDPAPTARPDALDPTPAPVTGPAPAVALVPVTGAGALSEAALADRMARLEGGAVASIAAVTIAEVDDGVGFFSGVRGRMGERASFSLGIEAVAPAVIALIAAPVAVSLTRAGRRTPGPEESQDEGVRPRGQTVAAATGR